MFKTWIENEEESQQWLGGSVLKTILYHGTNSKFDQFSPQKSHRYVLFSKFEVTTQGFFFTETYDRAKEYGRNVAACYVRMMRPLLDPRTDKHLGVNRLPQNKELDIVKILMPMVEEDKYGQSIDIGVQKYYLNSKNDEFPTHWIYNAIGGNGIAWDVMDNDKSVNVMKSLGYDGTFVDEDYGSSIFVGSSDQVNIVKWM